MLGIGRMRGQPYKVGGHSVPIRGHARDHRKCVGIGVGGMHGAIENAGKAIQVAIGEKGGCRT